MNSDMCIYVYICTCIPFHIFFGWSQDVEYSSLWRTLLFIRSLCNSLNLLSLNSQSISSPSLPPWKLQVCCLWVCLCVQFICVINRFLVYVISCGSCLFCLISVRVIISKSIHVPSDGIISFICGWVIVHSIDTPRRLYLSSCRWTLGCFHVCLLWIVLLWTVGCMCLFKLEFSQDIYAQEWDCRIVWQLYF